MKVTYTDGAAESPRIEPGDVLAFSDGNHLMITCNEEDEDDAWGFINLATGHFRDGFDHFTHMLNHVKKHYGAPFRHIKASRLELRVL